MLPAPKKFLLTAFILGLSGCFVLLPNPLGDRLFSMVLSRTFGLPAEVHKAAFYFPNHISFGNLELSMEGEAGLATGPGRIAFLGRHSLVEVTLGSANLGPFLRKRVPSSTLWFEKLGVRTPTLENSQWRIVRRDNAEIIRMVRGQLTPMDVRLGLVLKNRRVVKALVMLRLPRKLLPPDLDGLLMKNFSQDGAGRRICKISFSESGRCTVWGRSGRVLEAAWK